MFESEANYNSISDLFGSKPTFNNNNTNKKTLLTTENNNNCQQIFNTQVENQKNTIKTQKTSFLFDNKIVSDDPKSNSNDTNRSSPPKFGTLQSETKDHVNQNSTCPQLRHDYFNTSANKNQNSANKIPWEMVSDNTKNIFQEGGYPLNIGYNPKHELPNFQTKNNTLKIERRVSNRSIKSATGV